MAVKRSKPLTRTFKRNNPQVREELGDASSKFVEFADGQYAYGKLPPLKRNSSEQQDIGSSQQEGMTFHQYPNGWQHATLALGNGKGSILPASKFEFWCETIDFGYESQGSSAQSKFYQAYYSRTFNRLPFSIKGRVPTEKYKEDLQLWIREAQIRMARGEPRIYLTIPSAAIKVWGYIPSFAGGQEKGFSPAPEINFDFVVTRDVRVDRKGALSQQVIAYFLDPNDNYWVKQSRIFVDTAYDAYESEIEKDRADAKATTSPKVDKRIVDFFDRVGF